MLKFIDKRKICLQQLERRGDPLIKSITVKNYLNKEITLELTRPDKSGLIVKSVEGLGPAKANINVTDISTSDGGIFNSSRLDKRNIVMNLGFLQSSTESIEDIRQKTYMYFPIKKKVHLTIVTDNHTLETDGYIESNEPDIFSQNEGCSISIICPVPFFYSKNDNTTSFSGVESSFHFPFANDSLQDPLLEMGVIQNKSEQIIVYDGNSEIGMTIHIHATGEATNITILNVLTGDKMIINTDRLKTIMGTETAIIEGDTIVINTVRGDKSITLLRDGVTTNILNCLDRGSKWFTLTKGDNIFSYDAETGATNLQFYIVNKVAYDGV